MFLFQTPFPNYKDVDVSFSYKHVKTTFDLGKVDQTSQYSFKKQVILFVYKITGTQLSSPQILVLIRLEKLYFNCLSRHTIDTATSYAT
jgi:hypothetical protein